MKLVITIEETERILTVDISDDMTLADFQAYVEAETDIAPKDQVLLFNSRTLEAQDSTLALLGLKDDDLLILRKLRVLSSSSSVSGAAETNAGATDELIEMQRQLLLSDPMMSAMSSANPQFSSVLNNPEQFRNFVRASQLNLVGNGFGGATYELEIARLRSLPDTEANRKKIEELEDLQNIEENRMLLYEMAPESLIQVPMLYINMQVNKVPVKAFVDTGAQMTIMSPKLLKECGLHKLIDRRFQGEARGVGSGAILGRIHSAPVKIEDLFIPCTFVILDSGVDLILGLDMLRRHQANVNLKDMHLYISDVKTPFLQENEIGTSFFNSQSGGAGNVLGESSSSSKKQKLANPSAAAASALLSRASTSTSTSTTSTANVDPAKIDQLVALGFSRDQARTALAQCDGNVDMAASLLFQ